MFSYPSRRHAGIPPVPRSNSARAEAEFVASWQKHLEAGRLGSLTHMSPEELAVQRANEMAVLGRTPSFPAPILADLPRPTGWGR